MGRGIAPPPLPPRIGGLPPPPPGLLQPRGPPILPGMMLPGAPRGPALAPPTPIDPNKPKFRVIHWEKLKENEEAFEGTIFKEFDLGDDVPLPTEELEAAFAEKKPAPGAAGGKAAAAKVQLLDGRRQLDVGITFNKLRLKPEQVRDAVLAMDMAVFGEGAADKLDRLRAMAPTDEELKTLKAYDGDLDKVDDVQRFMVLVARIPRYVQRLDCAILRESLASDVKGEMDGLELLMEALTNLESSPKLHRLLQASLRV
ncbi:unnamed protein product, partial [Phaeothamnion confervicola]